MMGIIAKYKFNQNLYANFIPEFNSGFTNYTITDEIDTDGYTIRTIESDSLPTLMIFGQLWVDGETGATDKSLSLLEVYACNTSKVTTMFQMFRYCSSLISLNTSNFNTSQVTNMNLMFYACSSLMSLDASNFDTSKVTDMSNMFCSCTLLISLDLSNFDTSQVTTMNGMFDGCSSLTSLDVSNFDTNKVTNMYNMFSNCPSLTSLDMSNFDTNKVTNMRSMFYNCQSLTSLNLSNFDTSNVTTMNYMFQNCSSLISLDLSNFNTSSVVYMDNMFNNCSKLVSLDVSNFNTEKVTNMNSMFSRCSSLTSLDVSSFNTERVTNMQDMFNNCSQLTSLDLSNWNTYKLTGCPAMFKDCKSLKTLNVSGFNTEKVIWMNNLFRNCESLTTLDISNFKTTALQNAINMFDGCKSLKTLDISNFNTENITYIDAFFASCSPENIGMIYLSSSSINTLVEKLDTISSKNIWYSDAKLEDLTKKSNITYKEYKMNILESDEEIVLRRVGDVQDTLDLITGEKVERIGEFVLNGNDETWDLAQDRVNTMRLNCYSLNIPIGVNGGLLKTDKFPYQSPTTGDQEGAVMGGGAVSPKVPSISILKTRLPSSDIDGFKQWLSQNPITVQYQLETPVIKTINLEGKPSIDWQGDTYLHLENNTLYPQLDCEVESINYYEIPKLKANTLYTLRYIGEPTQCIFGGLTYETENNMILTSGSSDNLLYFDKEVRKVVLIEGDVRDRNFDYFEGIESLGAVEIITHKTNMPIFAKGGRI